MRHPNELFFNLVRGRWKVTFKDGRVSEGLFTLAMKKRAEGWRIVHDHTSVAG